jgi:hypothetical protein
MPSTSRAQQRIMGMALEYKRRGGDASPKIKDLADHMSEGDLHDFASTKHKGLPKKMTHLEKLAAAMQ